MSIPGKVIPKFIPHAASILVHVTDSLPHEVWFARMRDSVSVRDPLLEVPVRRQPGYQQHEDTQYLDKNNNSEF